MGELRLMFVGVALSKKYVKIRSLGAAHSKGGSEAMGACHAF